MLVAHPAYLTAIVLYGKLIPVPQGTRITASLSLPRLAMVFYVFMSLAAMAGMAIGALTLWVGETEGLYLVLGGVFFGAVVVILQLYSFKRFSDQRTWLARFLQGTLEAEEVSEQEPW